MTEKNGKVVRVVYYTIMPVIASASLFFGIGSKVGARDASSNPETRLESRIRALEVKQDERYEFMKREFAEIKARLNTIAR